MSVVNVPVGWIGRACFYLQWRQFRSACEALTGSSAGPEQAPRPAAAPCRPRRRRPRSRRPSLRPPRRRAALPPRVTGRSAPQHRRHLTALPGTPRCGPGASAASRERRVTVRGRARQRSAPLERRRRPRLPAGRRPCPPWGRALLAPRWALHRSGETM